MSVKPRKSNSRSSRSKASAESSLNWIMLLRDVLAWFLIVFSAVSLLASISQSYGSANQNWMGPYLGDALASNMALLLGKLPMLFYMASFVLTGLWMLMGERFGRLFRWMSSTWLLTLVLQLTLSLGLHGIEALSRAHFENHGGMIGVFFVTHLIQPVFGSAMVGPYIVMGVITLTVLIFGYGLQPKPVFLMISNGWAVFLARLQSWFDERRRARMPMAPPDPDTSDFPVVRRGEVRPFQAEGLVQPVTKATPQPVPLTPAPEARTVVNPLVDVGDFNAGIKRIEDRLLHARSMDPREVRALRDELAELRRISEMNEWEDRKAGELKIEGIVKPKVALVTEELATASIPAASDLTLVAHSKPIKEETVIIPPPTQAVQPKTPKNPTVVEPPQDFVPYIIPKVGEVLPSVPVQPVDYSEEELQQFSRMLEQQLENFRIKGKVIGIAAGPVITRFEVEPGPGVKVARFASLSDDLALALKASSIRILAPIPGKSVVGIEIPNRKSQIVYCREILESPRFLPNPYTLQIALGKDITGNAFVMDLARAPHLLIAGQTGSGKSVCINTLMASLLFSKSPDELRMILVDPKVVELKAYEKIPHLLHPVVTDPATAVQALQWACWEMDRRYGILAKAKVRNITGFNQKIEKGELAEVLDESENQRMVFIVIIVDEFADVIMQAKKEFEDPVIRLAQKARACGIHLVLATQRPSANVITGVIKANLPTRISFKVASHIDARTVLDHAGAERLLGRGDMLFRSIDDPEPLRVHGAYLSDDNAEEVAESCSCQHVDYPQLSSFSIDNPGASDGNDPLDSVTDPMFWEAAEMVVLSGGGSTSMLQRRLSVGYSRAGRIMDQLYRAGIVGPERGSKPREVLMGEEEISNLRRTRGV